MIHGSILSARVEGGKSHPEFGAIQSLRRRQEGRKGNKFPEWNSIPGSRPGTIPPMTIILLALAVTFAAFVVWLVVRFVNRRERWAKWSLILAVGLPVAYVASFGPACWISSRAGNGQAVVNVVYQPLLPIAFDDRGLLHGAAYWYVRLFAKDNWTVIYYGTGGYGHSGYEWGILPF
jgi:hypothetical protein